MTTNYTKTSNTMAVVTYTYRFSFMTQAETETREVEYLGSPEATEAQVRKNFSESRIAGHPCAISAFEFVGTFEAVSFRAEFSHDVTDSKGRALGQSVTIAHDRKGWEIRSHSTRGGKWFGALPPRDVQPTLEAAFVEAAKKVVAARKRAEKNKAAGKI